VGLRASMGNRLGIKAMVLTIGMLAGCETAIPNPRGSRLLTGSEMDQITAGSVGAINRAEAHAHGFTSQATASTSTLVASSSGTIAGPVVNAISSNYVSSQLSASAGNGQTATASGSNHVYVEGDNGVAQIDAAATAVSAGGGASHAQVSINFSGIRTSRADLAFGSVTAAACCAPFAEAQIELTGRAGGPYARELRSVSLSNTRGEMQMRTDIAVISSALPMIDPGQMSGLLTPLGSPK
jgi:hypothetical protein